MPHRALALLSAVCVLLGSPALALPGTNPAFQPARPAAPANPGVLQAADVVEQLNAQVPLDTELLDEHGKRVTLKELLSPERPTVLTLVYYECPALCSLVLNGLVKSLKEVPRTLGEDYQAVSVSIDPKDTPHKSLLRRRRELAALGRPEDAPWHFLTGQEAQVKRLADAVGFRYAYDEVTQQYAHPAVAMVLTPEGKVSRYLYGVDFPSRDVNFALVEAAGGKVGTSIERVILSCFQYDPEAKRYDFYIFGFLRIMGVVMLGAFGLMFFLSVRRERKQAGPPAAP